MIINKLQKPEKKCKEIFFYVDNRFYFSRIYFKPKTRKMNTITPDSSDNSGLIIGFSGTYYCLWHYAKDIYGNYRHSYIKRISTDIEKVKKLYPDYPIDMDLRGMIFDWSKTSSPRTKPTDSQFTFGRQRGYEISTSDDIKALWALYLTVERGIGRNKVYARRRLVELGLLVRYPNGGRYFRNRNYVSPAHAAKLEAAKVQVKGLFYNNGEKVVLSVKEIRSFSYETQYGTVFIVEYLDTENRVFKYKGNRPPFFENKDCFTTIKATIKHGNYKGQDETLIQRISIK